MSRRHAGRKAIKLLILHLASAVGGAERTTSNLLRYLDRTQVEHIILVAPEMLRRQLPADCDDFVDSDRYGLGGGFGSVRTLRADLVRVGALLAETQPDVALGMMHYPAALVVLGARLAGANTKTVASYRGPFYEYMRRYEHGLPRLIFLRAVIAATTLLADRVVVPSRGTKQELKRRFLGRELKTIVVPNGIDPETVAQALREPAPALGPLAAGRMLLCTAARLAPEKNLHLLLAAFRLVHKRRPVALVIVGDGPERAPLQASVADCGLSEIVRFVGYQDNVYPYLSHADVFVHTCQFEGFGYAMLEAMACGTPVIATDCPYGPREVLGDNQYGMLVAPDNPEALSAAILRLLDDAALRRRLAARGLERARHLTVRRMVHRYQAILTELALNAPGKGQAQ